MRTQVDIDYFIYRGKVSQSNPELIDLTNLASHLVPGNPACWDYGWATMPSSSIYPGTGDLIFGPQVCPTSSLSTEPIPYSFKVDLKPEKVF